jgi:hypothetical protein
MVVGPPFLPAALEGHTVIGFRGVAASGRQFKDLNDGTWRQVTINLRDLLDAVGVQKKVTPAQPRTTWNEDWVITSVRFGHFAAPAAGHPASEVYEFEDLRITK